MSLSQKENKSQNSTEKEIQTAIKKTSKIKKTFFCTICEKSFSTNGNLKNHINTIHNHILPFKCPYPLCKHSYSNQSRLSIHLRTHSGFKPYICPICKKSFNEKGNLKTHIGFHSNERPYKCNYCDKSYKTNGHLKDHIETHHFNLKKFVCNICQCKFGRRSTLSSHMRTHYGNVIFHNFKNVKCDEKIKEDDKNKNENKYVCFNGNLSVKLNLNDEVNELNIEDKNKNTYSNNVFNLNNNNQFINQNNYNNFLNMNFIETSSLINNMKKNDEKKDFRLFNCSNNYYNDDIKSNTFNKIELINKFINNFFMMQQMLYPNFDNTIQNINNCNYIP